jgi:transcriptional regulator with XRE-family HTH domain
MDQSLANVGPRVKALRQDRGLTLQEVSERCGVSVSTLSKLENGQVSGTVNTVLKVARGLGVLFDHLLGDEPEAAVQPMARLVRTKAEGAEILPTDFYDYHVHSSELVGRRMLPLVVDIKTRQAPPRVDWSTHDGEEFLLVLEGRVEFHSEYYAPIILEAGESIYFDSLMRHAYVSTVAGDARVVSISLAQDNASGTRETLLQRSTSEVTQRLSGAATEEDNAVAEDPISSPATHGGRTPS